MEIIDRIQSLETKNNNAKLEKAKLEERDKGLKEEKEKFLTSLKELGIKEEDLISTRDKMAYELNNQLDEIEKELK
jgi:hypothetical protein